jgi:hypothetical protein
MRLGDLAPAILAVAALARSAVAEPKPPGAPACPDGERFTFKVERPDGTPARGLQLHIEAGGSSGVRSGTDVVSDSGGVLICIRNARSGEMVEVSVAAADFRILYPVNRHLPLSREGSPEIVVCQVRRDCNQLTTAEISALIQKAQPRTQSMTTAEKQAFFREWAEYARQLGRETSSDNAQLLTALLRKERQVAAASRASVLLHNFANQAREVLERFDRHAERLLAYGDRRESDEMNKAYLDYNPVFDELKQRADSYLRDAGDAWSPEVSAELRALIDEALAIHYQGIHTLNDTHVLIIDCVKKRPSCPGPEASRAAVRQACRTVREVTLPRLARFEARSKAWLDSLDERLFGGQAGPEPAAGSATPPAGAAPAASPTRDGKPP